MELIKDYIEWDVENWSKAIKFWETNLNLDFTKLKCLELGSGHGGLSLWLASKGAKVICSDYENPERLAKPLHGKYNLGELIEYQAIDASNIPYNNEFDIVIFKSVLGAIARNHNDKLKKKTIEEIYKSLKPYGKLLFSENLKATKCHSLLRKRFIKWGDSWNYLEFSEIDNVFGIFSNITYETKGFLGTFGRTEKQRRILGKLDTLIFDKIVSNRNQYIIYGIAEKNSTHNIL